MKIAVAGAHQTGRATIVARVGERLPGGEETTMSGDPCDVMRERAGELSGVAAGNACNQSSFKVKKKSFFFVGPGARGIGFKVMFKLKDSMDQARQLAAERPERFDVGKTGWVTARFGEDDFLEREIWEPWLLESYRLSGGR